MRVLVVNTLYPPNLVGGAERSVADLAAALAALDATVTVLSITHGERRVEVANGVEARYVPLSNIFWPYASGGEAWWERRVWHLVDFHNPAMQAEVAAAIRETAPDIVHTNNLQGFSTAAWTAASSAGVPIVHTLRDHYLACARTTRWRGDQACARTCVSCVPFLVARRRASTQVTAVVGVSRHILDLHLELGFFPAARTRRVIYRTPSSIAASPRIVARGQPIRLGYLGRLVPIKGAALLLRAVQAGGPFELRVAGDGNPAFVASLRAMARGAPVTFLGHVDATSFLETIDVLVVPSLWHEPLARVILDALAAGVPVVASSRGGTPELVDHDVTGLLFDPAEPRGLEAALARIAADRALLGRWSEAALERTRRRAASPAGEAYVELFKELTRS